MYIEALLGGIISVLTPSVFFMTIISIIVFSKMDLKNDFRLFTISIFCLLIIIYYVIIGMFLNSTAPGILTDHRIKLLFVILNISIGLWLLGLLNVFSKNIESNKLFKSIGVVIISIVFAAQSYSATAPIIGTILIASIGETTILATVLPLLVFAVGFTIPIGLIVFLMSRFISKKKEKKWFVIVESLIGIIIITLTIVRIFLS